MRGVFIFLIFSLIIGVGIGIAISSGFPSSNDNDNANGKGPTLTINVTEPTAGREISDPVTVTGTVSDNALVVARLWDFEANLIGETQIETTSNQEGFNFTAEITYRQPSTQAGYLEVKVNNQKGEEKADATRFIPVKFSPIDIAEVFVFFSNPEKTDGSESCDEVLPLTRKVPADNLAENTLRALLEGPSPLEQQQGYATNIPAEAILNSLNVEEGTALVDFSDGLTHGLNESCQIQAVKTQIEKTLTQFDEIDKVLISINGESEGVLEF